MKWKPLIVSVLLALAAGGIGALLGGGMGSYAELIQPPLSPPGWVFPVVWTILYILMGVAAYRVYELTGHAAARRTALRLYALQLVVNALWPGFFFGLGLFWAAAVWLGILCVLVAMTMSKFRALDDLAGMLLAPYMLWCVFALYLNLGVAILNQA